MSTPAVRRDALGPYNALWSLGAAGRRAPLVLWALSLLLGVSGGAMLWPDAELRHATETRRQEAQARLERRGWLLIAGAGILSINGTILALRGREGS